MKISAIDTKKNFNLEDSFNNLDEIVQEIKKKFGESFKKIPKDNMNVNNLEKDISILSDFPSFQDRIRITIYGNKDSGKTSFINSIIGKELIPVKDEEEEGKMTDKKDIKNEKKDNNTSEESNKDMNKITQRIFILRNKEEGDTSLCRVNLKKVNDLANNIHISYNIFGTEEMYTSEGALKCGVVGEEEIKKFLTQPLDHNNKETKKNL